MDREAAGWRALWPSKREMEAYCVRKWSESQDVASTCRAKNEKQPNIYQVPVLLVVCFPVFGWLAAPGPCFC
jgi:hypothetical protein